MAAVLPVPEGAKALGKLAMLDMVQIRRGQGNQVRCNEGPGCSRLEAGVAAGDGGPARETRRPAGGTS